MKDISGICKKLVLMGERKLISWFYYLMLGKRFFFFNFLIIYLFIFLSEALFSMA